MARGDKPQKKKSRIAGVKKPQNVGWSMLSKKGTYRRGKGKKHVAKYSPARDARRIAEHKSVPGKPFSGDTTPVYYVVYKKSGRTADKRVWKRLSDIPKKYRNDPKYEIRRGWI